MADRMRFGFACLVVCSVWAGPIGSTSARAQGFYSTMPLNYGGYGGYNWGMTNGFTYGNYGGMNPYQAVPGLYNRNYYSPYGYGSGMYVNPIALQSMDSGGSYYVTPVPVAKPQIIQVRRAGPLKKFGTMIKRRGRTGPLIVRGAP